jgi:hypothetical protein
MAFGGSVLLLLGAFLPALSVPVLGSISYFDNGKGAGIFIVLLALASFILAARNRERFLLYTGSASAALVLAGMLYLMFKIDKLKSELASDASDGLASAFAGALSTTIQLQWGWAILLLGSLLVLSAGISAVDAVASVHTEPSVPRVSPRREYMRAGGVGGAVLMTALVGHALTASTWGSARTGKASTTSSVETSPGLGGAATIVAPPGWEVSVDTNAIDGSTKSLLRLSSTKPVVSRFGQAERATLILRCDAGKFQAYIVTPSQLESNYATDAVAVRVRFDEAPPEAVEWTESTGGSAMFAPQPKALVKRLLTTRRFLVEYPPFQQTPTTVEFAPAGLDGELSQLAGCSLS